jgi:hypothetical protein
MGILWFGRAKTLEDLNVKDLRKERIRQEVEQDGMVSRIRRAQDEYDGYLDAASEPYAGNAEIEVAAYKMDRAMKRKSTAENHLQQVITRIHVIDSTVDILEQRKELEKKGIWKIIAGMDEDRLQEQLQVFAAERKESQLGVNKIAELLDVDDLDVKARRGAGYRRAKDAILSAKEIKRV